MVFCCIAIVAMAICYFFGLWIRQLFLGRHRDSEFAAYLPPPRALAGKGAWPVYGHTRLFRRHVGDVALLFDPVWTECGCLSTSRSLGDCFAIFIWGQWRICIQGPDRARQFLEHQTLHEGWPWTPPVTLLGKSCLAFLQHDDPSQAASLRSLLETPLSGLSIQKYAPLFALAAEKCLRTVEQGKPCLPRSPRKQVNSYNNQNNNSRYEHDKYDCASPWSLNEDEDEDEGVCWKLKWDALRSYSLDLINGPLFQMNLWNKESQIKTTTKSSQQQSQGQSTQEDERNKNSTLQNTNTTDHSLKTDFFATRRQKKDKPPSRQVMLLWMERMKLGLDVIKLTFGPEWMYVWICNEYGRAIHARMRVETLMSQHVQRMSELVPQITHERGHVYHEPTTQPFPLLAMRQNLMRNKENIYGDYTVYPAAAATIGNRTKCNSMPTDLFASVRSSSSPLPKDDDECLTSPYVQPFQTEQDLARHSYKRQRKQHDDESMPPDDPLSEWMEEFDSDRCVSPLSQCEWGTSPVPCWNSRSMTTPLDDSETSTNSSPPLETEIINARLDVALPVESQPIVSKNKKKSVSDIFNEIKANRETQLHLSEDNNNNHAVYSFFNPTQQHSLTTSVSVPKSISTPSKMLQTKPSDTRPVPRALEKDAMIHPQVNETSSRPTRQATVVNPIQSPPLKAEAHGKKEKSKLSSSLKKAPANSRVDNEPTITSSASLKTDTVPRTPAPSFSRQHRKNRNASVTKKKVVVSTSDKEVCSLLETMLEQRGREGKGISQTTLMELSINLWMMLDVGNVWTAMALHLLAWDETALGIIHEELDLLEIEFGGEQLFSPESLDRMKYLDALIYESIRLVPPFLGGLKSTTETVILKDAGVQIPKGSHIFFCQPSQQEFDLFAAVGKRPECLGQRYPCVELFGFLPLQGLEVPLMVLQCKVFLVVTLRNCAPTVSKRNTFIRRVKSAVKLRKSNDTETPEVFSHSLAEFSDMGDAETGSNFSSDAWNLEDGVGQCRRKMTPHEAMKRFTKIPFPEPKRVIRLKPRGLQDAVNT